MKYIFSVLFIFFFIVQSSYSQEICNTGDYKKRHGYIEVQYNVNMRTESCTSNSEVLGVAPAQKIYYVIGETKDFYLVEKNWKEKFWLWKGAVEPFYGYTQYDKKANDFVQKVEDIYEKNGKEIDKAFVQKIQRVLVDKRLSQSETALLREIIFLLNNKVNTQKIIALEDVSDDIWDEEENINDTEDIDDTQEKDNTNQEDQEDKKDENNQETEDKLNDLSSFKIDYQQAQKFWLQLNNNEREKRGLYDYTFNQTLHNSAQTWSNVQAQNGLATHKRNLEDPFYDYQEITKWLKSENVVCKNVDKYTHTENIAWGEYYCDSEDCTSKLQQSMERRFNDYMQEEFEDYKAHFLSIVNEYFKEIGVGITIKETAKNSYEFYLTIHYCTELQ